MNIIRNKKERIQITLNKSYFDYWGSISYTWNEEKCFVCNLKSFVEKCHITAFCYGGNSTVKNIVLLCKICHKEFDSRFTGKAEEYDEQINYLKTIKADKYNYLVALLNNLYIINNIEKNELNNFKIVEILFSKEAYEFTHKIIPYYYNYFDFFTAQINYTQTYIEKNGL